LKQHISKKDRCKEGWETYNKNREDNYDEDGFSLEEYLNDFDIDDLMWLGQKLNIVCEHFKDMSKKKLIEKILELDNDIIKDTCEDLFNYTYEDFKGDYEMNNTWRYSDYEDKDIGDWSVDDHLAAWYDHVLEK
jgi:hypothetical protein